MADLSSKTVKQLKDKLRSLNFKVSGNKADLIQRIIDAQSTTEEPPPRARSPNTGKVLTGVNEDVDRLILLKLDDIRLNAVCTSDKYANSVCNDKFWKLRVDQKYGEDVAATKPKGISYRRQYFDLPRFVKKHGKLLIKGREEAAQQGRLDAFIAYKELWNHDYKYCYIFNMLIQRGYRNILKEIILTYGDRPIKYLYRYQLRVVFAELSKREDFELLDLIYKQYLDNESMKQYYMSNIIYNNASDKILQWAIDNDLIDVNNINNIVIYMKKKDQLQGITYLSELNILPTNPIYTSYIFRFSPAALQFLINKGLIPNVEAANNAAEHGNIEVLELLEKHGILPDSRGANAALEYIYYRDKIRKFKALKWMYEREILPNDIIFVRIALNPRQIVIENPKNVEIYNWLKSSYEGLLN